MEMLKRWPLQLLTCVVLFNCLFCIKIPCDQTYETENGHLCYPCSPGYYKVSDCVVNGEQARCRRCGNGKYQPYCDTSTKCARCRLFCPNGQVPVKHCNATSNKECQCKAGSFWEPDAAKSDEGHCKPHSKCGPGEGRIESGTPYEDTKCEPCKEGVSYSDNSSFDTCKPCSICNTTIITNCTDTNDTVCGYHSSQRPSQTKKSSKRLGVNAIVGIVCSVIFVVVLLVLLVVAIIIYRRKKTFNRNTESCNVDLSETNTNIENGLENSHSLSQTSETETPEDIISANENDSSDDSEEDSVMSYANLQQSREHGCENNAFDSQSCTEIMTQNEPENDNNFNDIQNAPETECYQSPQTTGNCSEMNKNLVNDSDLNPDLTVNDVHTVTTESGDENLKEEDPNEQIQVQSKNEYTEYRSKNTDSNSLRSGNENTLPDGPVKNIDSPLEGKITAGSEKIKYDESNINNDESTDVSTDAAAVSPRSSLQSEMSHGEDTSGENITEETESEVGSQFAGDFEDDRSEKTIRSDNCSRKERIWFETLAFIAQNLKWSDFCRFVRRLVGNTNSELQKTINVVLEHAQEENKACINRIYSVMSTWRQATPKETVQAVFDALNECSLKLTCKELEDALIQKGLLDRRNSSLSNAAEQNEETAEKHFSPPGECSLHVHNEINHEMHELKVPETEIFC